MRNRNEPDAVSVDVGTKKNPSKKYPLKKKKNKSKVSVAKPGKGLTSDLLSIEEKRSWKSHNPQLKAALSKIWLSSAELNIKIFVPVPSNTVAYGNFQFSQSQDNLGTKMKFKGFNQSALKKISSYDLKKVKKGQGFIFPLSFSAPRRNAKSFKIQGKFFIQQESKIFKLELPSYSKLKSEKAGYQAKVTPGLSVTIQNLGASFIRVKLTGDSAKIVELGIQDGAKYQSPSSFSFYSSRGGKIATYWFRRKISDKAKIVVRYYKAILKQPVVINITKQQLP